VKKIGVYDMHAPLSDLKVCQTDIIEQLENYARVAHLDDLFIYDPESGSTEFILDGGACFGLTILIAIQRKLASTYSRYQFESFFLALFEWDGTESALDQWTILDFKTNKALSFRAAFDQLLSTILYHQCDFPEYSALGTQVAQSQINLISPGGPLYLARDSKSRQKFYQPISLRQIVGNFRLTHFKSLLTDQAVIKKIEDKRSITLIGNETHACELYKTGKGKKSKWGFRNTNDDNDQEFDNIEDLYEAVTKALGTRISIEVVRFGKAGKDYGEKFGLLSDDLHLIAKISSVESIREIKSSPYMTHYHRMLRTYGPGLFMKTKDKPSPKLLQKVLEAVKHNDLTALKRIPPCYVRSPMMQDDSHNSPIMLAIMSGNTDIVTYLKSIGADMEHENLFGQTPKVLMELHDPRTEPGVDRTLGSSCM
jgi:hypothetical protein